jgi:aryl-alcohol dehydrogenase-like predicted oxidoreductase
MRFGPGRLGLGTAPLGSTPEGPLWWGPQPRARAIDTVLAAIDAGVAFIDTAPFYGWGRAESIVGEALAAAATRPPVLTKCGTVRRPDGTFTEDGSRRAVRADVMASLDRLGVDCIDVVQVHDPDPTTPIEETWEALLELRGEGLIGGAGLSNHPVELMDRADALGPLSVVQHQYSLLWRRPELDGVLAWCAGHGVPMLAWSPLASGFLTDEFDLGTLHPDDLRHRLQWAGDERARMARVRVAVEEVARRRGVSMVRVALAWAGRHEQVLPIVGARSRREAIALADPLLELTADELAVLEDAGVDGADQPLAT